jgi:hypothetical protein
MPKAILTQAIFSGFSSRADGSLGFRGMTPELNHAEKVALMELHQQNVKLLIQPLEATPEAMVEVKNELGFKTPGQRLRGVLFIEFKQRKTDMPFEVFYGQEMEKIIEDRKSRLEPET